ncbi:protein tyrosine phosphatase [Sphingobium sp. C100]|jgi:protein-tyrosine phosphatase|uniref:tyrosine-protein phosphatase n=1 Tax=Sphingobium sp. C100 TaxID=1207055 RepID=UPI0003D5B1FB|nr:tyrosine-protein phosphatase [Sphingobium sp. C100]ETI62016.1 protein tyrosine phosphatase [Sphingobium sp. C100]
MRIPHIRALSALLCVAGLALPATALAQAQPQPQPVAHANGQHERLLPLEGGQNFRDLGGYRTTDGRMVKWGVLLRSGAMSRLTDKDFAYLASLGLKTVVDFRDTRERTAEPVNWPEASKPAVFERDYAMDHGMFMNLLMEPGITADEAKETMATLYRDIPNLFADQYRTLFEQLLATDGTVAFNCTAGKDRTGVAAAILLSVLGVDRETAIQDYLLSNRYFKPQPPEANDPSLAMFNKLPPEVLKTLMGVDRSFIEGAFATMDAYPGGIKGYYREKLGLDDLKIARLRAKFLTAA